jgi:hypothetical protein
LNAGRFGGGLGGADGCDLGCTFGRGAGFYRRLGRWRRFGLGGGGDWTRLCLNCRLKEQERAEQEQQENEGSMHEDKKWSDDKRIKFWEFNISFTDLSSILPVFFESQSLLW